MDKQVFTYVKWGAAVLALILIIMIFAKTAKWINSFFGFDDDDDKAAQRNVSISADELLAVAGDLGIDPDFPLESFVKDLHTANTTSYYNMTKDSPRCQAYKRAYKDTNDAELTAIAIAYEKAFDTRLKTHISETNWNGCKKSVWTGDDVGDDYKKLLLTRLDQTNV